MDVIRKTEPVQQSVSHDEKTHNLEGAVDDGDDALKVLHSHFEPYTKAEEKKVLRKIDLRLILLMFIVNGTQFVDKLTISQAATYGIISEAHLIGQEFSLLISLFYIGYLIAQYPTNYLMQRFPTGKYLAVNFAMWGVVLTATASATNFPTLAVSRFFLGVFESCINPGFVLITSSWWKREEQTARIGLWYCANGLIGGPAGLIFWGIAHMSVGGWFPYQWMFLFFGLFTVVFGIALWWLLPSSPLTARWLTERERIIAVERLKSNKTGVKNNHHKKEQVIEALTDYRVWMLVLAVFWHNMTNSLQSNFTGLIIKGFGYNTYQAVLLSIPSAIIMAVATILVTFFLSSRWGEGKRIIVIILCYIPGVVSCILLYLLPNETSTLHARLGAVFIIGIVAAAAGITYSLLASNIAGYTKKTVSGAMFFSSYCVANIISPQTFLASQAPRYQTGITISLAAFCINIVLFIILYFVYWKQNKARDQDPDGAISEDPTMDLVDSFSDLSDKDNKKLRYKM